MELRRSKLPTVVGGAYALYLPELKELLGIDPKTFQKEKIVNPDKFLLRIFLDNDRLIICKGSEFQALRPPGVDMDLWKGFVAAMLHKYGITGAKHAIISFFNEVIRKEIYTILDLGFGIKVEVGKFDPSKLDRRLVDRLPKDLRSFLFGDINPEKAKGHSK